MFWISGVVSSGYQSQSVQPYSSLSELFVFPRATTTTLVTPSSDIKCNSYTCGSGDEIIHLPFLTLPWYATSHNQSFIVVCLPPYTVGYWNQPASLIVPQPVAYRSFDTLDGLTLMEGVQQANFDPVVSGMVCFSILKVLCHVLN